MAASCRRERRASLLIRCSLSYEVSKQYTPWSKYCTNTAAGIVHLLKTSSQPIKDGHCHLIPFCETLESIFRDGLKRMQLSE